MGLPAYQTYLITAKKKDISEHFTEYEVCHSDTALAKGIDNRPTAQVLTNATALIKNVLEPIRKHFNKSVNVNCMYRCPALNSAIGGVATSQHCKGQAADITVSETDLKEVFKYIKTNLIFDQVIFEGTWIHVSFNPIKNRKQSLKLVSGKYLPA